MQNKLKEKTIALEKLAKEIKALVDDLARDSTPTMEELDRIVNCQHKWEKVPHKLLYRCSLCGSGVQE